MYQHDETCGAWFAHVFTYIYIYIWQQYYLDYFSTLNRNLSMCWHANELLSSLFCWGLNDRYYIYVLVYNWMNFIFKYIYTYWNSFAHRTYMFMCFLSIWIIKVVSYVINDVIIHHFRSSLFSFRIAIFLEDVPFPDIFVNFLMHGIPGTLPSLKWMDHAVSWVTICLFLSNLDLEKGHYIQVYSPTTWFLALHEFGFRAKFPEFSNLFYHVKKSRGA